MTRHSSTTTRPHSLLPLDMYCHTLDWDRCILPGGEEESYMYMYMYVLVWKEVS